MSASLDRSLVGLLATFPVFGSGDPVASAATITLGALTSTANGAVAVVGASTVTLGDATLSSDGTVANAGVNGTLNATLGTLTSTSAGVVLVAGDAAIALDALTSTSAGVVPVQAVLSGWKPTAALVSVLLTDHGS